MRYFSYNDYVDCTENEEIKKIIKVEENLAKYEIKNGEVKKEENKIILELKKKTQLTEFIKKYLNIYDIEKISYCKNINAFTDRENQNNITCKIENKEIFIFIKVIEEIDNNISYKMFEHSLNIIKNWNKEEKRINVRYPIVIPIVIYDGKEKWKKSQQNKVNYTTFEENRINFSYNIINIKEIKENVNE
jgi:hypothetical protein